MDAVVINAESQQEDPKHVEAMIARAEGTPPADPPQEDQKPQRPEHIPEKFWDAEKGEVNVEALAKSYTELESKNGQKQPEEKKPEEKSEEAPTGDADEALKSKGLDLNEFSQEFNEKGELSAESYKKLEDAGFNKQIVDQYIAGQKALADAFVTDVQSVVGGAEKFSEVAEWAKTALTDEEKIAYNAAVDSRDAAKAKLAVQGLYAKFQAERPNEPNLVQGQTSAVAGEVYESLEQMKADMRDPKYRADPAFRKKVQDKLARSSIL